jgi:hypothetical protein
MLACEDGSLGYKATQVALIHANIAAWKSILSEPERS